MVKKIIFIILIALGVFITAPTAFTAGNSYDLREGHYYLKYNSENIFQWGLAADDEEIVAMVATKISNVLYSLSFRGTGSDAISLLRRIEATGEIGWENEYSSYGNNGIIFVGWNDDVILCVYDGGILEIIVYDSMGNEKMSFERSANDVNFTIRQAEIDGNGNIILGMDVGSNSWKKHSATIEKYDSSGKFLYQYRMENAFIDRLSLDNESNPYYVLLNIIDKPIGYSLGRLDENGEQVWEKFIELSENADFGCAIGEPEALLLDETEQEISFVGLESCAINSYENDGMIITLIMDYDGKIIHNGQVEIYYPNNIFDIQQDQNHNIYVIGDDWTDRGMAVTVYSMQSEKELWQWKETNYHASPDYNVQYYHVGSKTIYLAGELGFFRPLLEQGRVKPFYSVYNGSGNLEVENILEIMPIYNTKLEYMNISNADDVYLFVDIVKRNPPKDEGKKSNNDDNDANEGCGC